MKSIIKIYHRTCHVFNACLSCPPAFSLFCSSPCFYHDTPPTTSYDTHNLYFYLLIFSPPSLLNFSSSHLHFLRSCIGHPLLEIIIKTIHESFINKEIETEKKIAEEKRKELLETIQHMTIFSSFLSAEENISIANIGGEKKEFFIALFSIALFVPSVRQNIFCINSCHAIYFWSVFVYLDIIIWIYLLFQFSLTTILIESSNLFS